MELKPFSRSNFDSYHRLFGHIRDSEGTDPIQIEYRFLTSGGCEIYTRIRDRVFHQKGDNFFGVVSELLDTLPPNSSLVFEHLIPIVKGANREFASLEETISPYHSRNSGAVLYKLKLTVDGDAYETKPNTDFGGAQDVDGGVLEQLQRLVRGRADIQVCWFCRFLVEYNEIGGTDYRHDQMHCFRGKPELLQQIDKVYPRLYGYEDILAQTIHNLSALHSCDGFERNIRPRP